MKDPRGRSVYDDVPINGGESDFRSFDEEEGGEDLPCMSESCAAGNCDGCTDVEANCCECNCHLRVV